MQALRFLATRSPMHSESEQIRERVIKILMSTLGFIYII